MPVNPIDAGAANERALHDALMARMRGIRRIAERDIADAVRTGRYGGITQGEAWGAGLDRATAAAHRAEIALLRRGWLQGVKESGAKELRAEADAFAERWAGQRTASFLAGFEQRTRDNVAREIRNAGARFHRSPNPTAAQRAAERIRTHLGLTRAQARRLEAYQREAAKAELAQRAIDREVARRALAGMESRARMEAEFEAVEAVNFARAAAWAEARRRGLVGKLEKRWQDMGDSRVRAHHAAQTNEGWIPWSAPYTHVGGVQHPPAPEPGCRCWQIFREVKRGEAAA